MPHCGATPRRLHPPRVQRHRNHTQSSHLTTSRSKLHTQWLRLTSRMNTESPGGTGTTLTVCVALAAAALALGALPLPDRAWALVACAIVFWATGLLPDHVTALA